MAATNAAGNVQRPFIILASIALITAGLYFAQKILMPLAMAILFTFILTPLVNALQRRGLGRVLSAVVVMTLALLLLTGVGVALGAQIKNLAAELPKYRGNIVAKIGSFRVVGEGTFVGEIQRSFQGVFSELLGGEGSGEEPTQEPIPVRVQNPRVLSLGSAVAPALEFLASAALVIVLVVFMLIQREDLRNRVVRLVGHGRLITATRALEEAADKLSRFLLMQLMVNSAFGLAVGVGLTAIGLPYPVLWAILAGLLRYVPYVGTAVTFSLVLLVSVAVSPGWTQTALALGLLVVLEVVTANVVEPLLFGHSTGVSPVALLVAAAFWTWLWGPIGLILSTPMTVCLVVLGRHVPNLGFLGVVLGDEPPLPVEVTFYQRLLAHDQDEATDLVEDYLTRNPPESVPEAVLAPALVLAKRDDERGELAGHDRQFIVQAMRDIVDEIAGARQAVAAEGAAPPAPAAPAAHPVTVFGCPARDEADELLLAMLRQEIEPSCRTEVLSAKALTAEVIERIRKEPASVVCVAALPPGGLAQARYLCKRLRQSFPELKILVVRWGQAENFEQVRNRLIASGADEVVTTLEAARSHLIPWVQALSHALAATKPPPKAEASAKQLAPV